MISGGAVTLSLGSFLGIYYRYTNENAGIVYENKFKTAWLLILKAVGLLILLLPAIAMGLLTYIYRTNVGMIVTIVFAVSLPLLYVMFILYSGLLDRFYAWMTRA